MWLGYTYQETLEGKDLDLQKNPSGLRNTDCQNIKDGDKGFNRRLTGLIKERSK